ncbi:MAG: PAS domain S-box protein [Bacteroidales bacterium]
MSTFNRNKSTFPWLLVGISFVALTVIVLLSSIYNSNYKGHLYDKTFDELQSIAKLKALQVEQWRHDRIGYANTIKDNVPLRDAILSFLDRNDYNSKNDLLKFMSAMTINHDIRNGQLIDKNGVVRLSWPAADTIYGKTISNSLEQRLGDTSIFLSDFHENALMSFIHIDMVIPVWDVSANSKMAVALLVFRIDPYKVLYPDLQSWPVPSESSEAILVRQDGDSVTYLNDLKYVENAALKLKRPLMFPDLVATKAVSGIHGSLRGADYRGVEILAVAQEIEGTSWFVIAKTDKKEVEDSFKEQIFIHRVLSLFFILSIFSVIASIAWNRKVRYYRQKYENELEKRALAKHYQYILKYANDIVLLLDLDLNIIQANDRAVEAYGYSLQELTSMNLSLLRLPEYIDQLKGELDKLDKEGSTTFETIHRRKNGTTIPIEISARLFEIDGVRYYQSIGRDITDRKKTELKIRDTEQTYTVIFNTVTEAIYVHKMDGVFIDVNIGAEKMYGYSRNELIGMTPASVGAPGMNDLDEVVKVMKRVFETGREERFEFWGLRKNGEIFPKEVVTSKGKYFGEDVFISTARDITDWKKAESELIAARDKAEESDRLKTAFLHNISHEIRTPMNAIVGFTALLEEPDLDEDTRKHFTNIIYHSTNQLLAIITDIVDISNIDANQVKISRSRVCINTICRNALEQFSLNAEQAKLIFRCELPLPDEMTEVTTDGTKLLQILSNLINNALKFTRQGTVWFGYTKNLDSFEFYVSDTGIGIPKALHAQIFDRFYQVDNDSSRQFGGAGLGLSICKAYVELLGGRIWVESSPGKGSTFRFIIPLS